MAPTFTLPSQDGTQISLDSFKGKWVVLYFYPKDMTTGCTIEAHNFQRDQEKYTQENAVILGVSVDSTDSHKQFCTKENLTFRLLADPDKKVVKAYGSLGSFGWPAAIEIAKRNTFLIDPSGKIVKVWTGVSPTSTARRFWQSWQPSNRKACKNGRMSQVSDQFTQGCAEIRAALFAFPAASADTPYRPGGWTRKQVLGHMFDSASNNHQRFVRAATRWPLFRPGLSAGRLGRDSRLRGAAMGDVAGVVGRRSRDAGASRGPNSRRAFWSDVRDRGGRSGDAAIPD